MENTKEMYDFISSAWQYVKTTKAPAQTDNEAWSAINDEAMKMCKEFQTMIVDWLYYLRKESMNG